MSWLLLDLVKDCKTSEGIKYLMQCSDINEEQTGTSLEQFIQGAFLAIIEEYALAIALKYPDNPVLAEIAKKAAMGNPVGAAGSLAENWTSLKDKKEDVDIAAFAAAGAAGYLLVAQASGIDSAGQQTMRRGVHTLIALSTDLERSQSTVFRKGLTVSKAFAIVLSDCESARWDY